MRAVGLKRGLSLLVWGLCACSSVQVVKKEPAAPSVVSEIDHLISQMTIEEKVGQMTQLTMSMFSPTPRQQHKGPTVAVDRAKLKEAIGTYHVGSLFNIVDNVGDSTELPEAWRDLQKTIIEVTAESSRLKIPILFGVDAVHGANYTRGAILFPQAIGQGATFDRGLVGEVAAITAKDVAASGIAWNFSPVVDVARQPLWPRVYETFGEQSWVVRELGVSAITHHKQSLPCLKHYFGYSASVTGHDRTPANVGERTLRDIYLPPFEAAIRAGAPSIMINSGSADGTPLNASHYWLTTVLRDELGFDGVAVTDYEDIARLYTRDKVADSPKEAVRMGIMAGIDMSMVPEGYAFTTLLAELVHEGKVPMARIDASVRRILTMKMKAHLIGPNAAPMPASAPVGTPEDKATSLKVARASMTLLKNKGDLLPLVGKKRIVVTGPQADSLPALAGGWTYTWQGGQKGAYDHEGPTIVEAIRSMAGAAQVIHAKGRAQAVAAAKKADVAIVCIGEAPYAEWFGNIDDLTLDAEQLALAQAIEATGTPVVLVLVEGRARIIRPIVDKADAIVMAYLPGFEGGRAIAETLFGHNNPSGRLPMTYPRSTGHLVLSDAVPAEYQEDGRLHVEWPVGEGLGYSNFVVSDLHVPKAVPLGHPVIVTARITNSGKRAGRHSALLYLHQRYASILRPLKEIRGFLQVELKPGESQDIRFELAPYDLSFVAADNKRHVEPGVFDVEVGALKQSFVLQPQAVAP